MQLRILLHSQTQPNVSKTVKAVLLLKACSYAMAFGICLFVATSSSSVCAAANVKFADQICLQTCSAARCAAAEHGYRRTAAQQRHR
jgi:hypothetical protein